MRISAKTSELKKLYNLKAAEGFKAKQELLQILRRKGRLNLN